MYVAKPKVTKVSCLRNCASRARAQGGSTLKITGSGLAAAAEVVFNGSFGKGDDLAVRVRPGGDKRINARVPIGAITGPLTVMTAQGAASNPTAPLAILPPPPPSPNAVLSPAPGPHDTGAPDIETGTSRTKAYVGARRAVTFSYRVSGALASALTVELVRASDGLAVKTWAPPPPPSGEVQSVSWDGRIDKLAAKPGRYSFRLIAATAAGAQVRSAQVGDFERDAFDLYDHMFPIRGKHDYGGAGAGFGTGRAGHSHQGHDVFAKCGTPMVAARGGRVKFKQYHAAAGNYLVVDGAGQRRRLRVHAPRRAIPLCNRRPGLHRTAHRLGRRDGQRARLPPALRALGRTRLVRRRQAVRPAPLSAGLGFLVLGGSRRPVGPRGRAAR